MGKVKAIAPAYRNALLISGFTPASSTHMAMPEGMTRCQAKSLANEAWRVTAITRSELAPCGCCWRALVVGWRDPLARVCNCGSPEGLAPHTPVFGDGEWCG